MSIEKVISNEFCVGCGTCKLALHDNANMKLNNLGFYNVEVKSETDLQSATKLCPFSNDAKNETKLGSELYKSHLKYDERVGYFSNVYAGSIKDSSIKINSSSGGLTSWFIKKLLINNEVDAVIHVGQSESDSALFEYKISESVEDVDLKGNKKSRYYPVSLASIIEKVESSNKTFVFVGIPCFVKSIRLAQSEGYLKNIKFCISLLCGHMKSAAFAENLAWQVGVSPERLKTIDFRMKSPEFNANNYFIEVTSDDDRKVLQQNSKLLGSNWGHGFFKHKSCDFCDDLAGELADVTFGDAWLPRYVPDYQGTNIVVSRHELFDNYISEYSDELFIDELTVEDFFESQAGNYRHRRDGLKPRSENISGWIPNKRLELSKNEVSQKRKEIYLTRYYLSQKSNELFMLAKKKRSYSFFKLKIVPVVFRYELKANSFKSALKFAIKMLLPDRFLGVAKRVYRIF